MCSKVLLNSYCDKIKLFVISLSPPPLPCAETNFRNVRRVFRRSFNLGLYHWSEFELKIRFRSPATCTVFWKSCSAVSWPFASNILIDTFAPPSFTSWPSLKYGALPVTRLDFGKKAPASRFTSKTICLMEKTCSDKLAWPHVNLHRLLITCISLRWLCCLSIKRELSIVWSHSM